jgi:hypothetical protein
MSLRIPFRYRDCLTIKAMKDYIITILTRTGVLVNDELWKADSMEHAERRVNKFLHDKEFKGKAGKNDSIKITEEKIGNNIKWLEVTSQPEGMPAEVFFVSMEEENGTRWALKNA